MKQIALERLTEGITVMMMVGAPVRQWMRRLRGGPQAWLTPVRYTPISQDRWEPTGEPRFVEVEVSKVMLPYVIVYHHTDGGSVKLWIDTRRTGLFTTEE